MTTQALDQAKAEAFAGQMLELLNHAAVNSMISVGRQAGLFETLSRLSPSTSEQIARAAKLQERYVREWLAVMVTGRVVEYDPGNKTYRLPAEHAAFLTRAAGPDDLSIVAQEIVLMSLVEEHLIDCFRNGGGVTYPEYKNFQRIQAEETTPVYDATLIGTTLPLAPGLVARLEAGIEVADFGCGAGHAINLMAKTFPKSRFAGYDFSEEGLALARAEAKEWGLANVQFEAKDIATSSDIERFDLITAFDVIHDQAKPRAVLAGIAQALRPDGMFLMVDMAGSSNLEENMEHPIAPTLYTLSVAHCMTVSLGQGGEGLGTMWGEQKAKELLAEAGFTKVSVKKVEGDFLHCYYIAGK